MADIVEDQDSAPVSKRIRKAGNTTRKVDTSPKTEAKLQSTASRLKHSGVKKISAKALKGAAAEKALEGNPARFLGVNEGARPVRLASLVAQGLSTKSAVALAESLDIPVGEFTAKYVHIPKQTMTRRRSVGKFTVDESDRFARYARLLKYATDMMEGDEDAARRWLKTPQLLLEDLTPLEYARTESGAVEVQQLIGRIEAGVYS